jgi:hypothetical protein
MLTRTCTISLLLVLGLAAGTVTATADDDGWGTVECDQVPSPHCDLEAGATNRPYSTPGPVHTPATDGADQPTCAYQPSQFQGHPDTAASWPPQTWYEGRCELTGAIVAPKPVDALTPDEIARLARNQLRLQRPQIGSSPPGDQLVNLPTWLYLASGWRAESATASVPGISVTATASPTSVTWSLGDGTTVDCAGPGTDYRQDVDPRSESPQCGHTYRRSSGRTTFPVSATVHWAVAWSGAGQVGMLPELITTSTTQFRVRESQALNVTPPTR